VYEKHIGSRDFDFIGLMTDIEEFGRRHQISQKTIYRAQSVFEELCVQILLPQLPDPFGLLLTCSYAPREERMTMRLRYSGPAFDPADADNALSLALVRNAAEQITYAPIDEDGMTNQVDVTIR
jgi:hypothetical protein